MDSENLLSNNNGIFHRNIYFLNPKIHTEVPKPPTNQNEFRQEEQI